MRGQFHRKATRQAFEAGLGGADMDAVLRPDMRRYAAHRDDRAAARRDHMRHAGPGADESAVERHGQDLAPLREAPLGERGLAPKRCIDDQDVDARSDEHTSEHQSLMRISYAVFCLKKKKTHKNSNNL